MTSPDRARLTALLEEWLRVDSTSGDEREFLERLEAFFVDDKWQVERQDVARDRWNLIVSDGAPERLLFSTHVDTVPPFLPVSRKADGMFHS